MEAIATEKMSSISRSFKFQQVLKQINIFDGKTMKCRCSMRCLGHILDLWILPGSNHKPWSA